jgi:dihydrofolate reductase
MTFTTTHMSMSLDGFVAGPDQSVEQGLGRRGIEVHRWHLPSEEPQHEVDARWTEMLMAPRGAYVMGRHMFGPVRGGWDTWDSEWRGWWGEEPPYHAPVFVLTHHEREPLELEGTTFHFVTGGFAEALRLAREAGDGDVDVAGGASTVRQALAAGEIDELRLDIAPVLLGEGERIFEQGTTPRLELLESESSPHATHLRYAVHR